MINLYPFLAYVVVTTFTPGPNNIMAMSNAMHHGYRRTLGFLAGMTAGFFLVMLACGILNAVPGNPVTAGALLAESPRRRVHGLPRISHRAVRGHGRQRGQT